MSNRVANSIGKIDLQTLTLVDSYNAPGGPDCMDISRDGKQRWKLEFNVREGR